jgi:hypothetical protein
MVHPHERMVAHEKARNIAHLRELAKLCKESRDVFLRGIKILACSEEPYSHLGEIRRKLDNAQAFHERWAVLEVVAKEIEEQK